MSKEYFDFNDVRLIPKKTIVGSRDEVNTYVVLGKHRFKLGVVPANMLCTISENLCISLAKNEYFYIYHRFMNDTVRFVAKMNTLDLVVSIAIGVNEDSFKVLNELKHLGLRIDYITIDIANGYSTKLENMAKFVKDNFPDTFLIGGNVATEEGVAALAEWGCSAAKAGIGPGHSCSTYMTTSVGSSGWQASMINQLSKSSKIPIICDGGIRTVGHINVAFAMGATFVMIGSMFSGFKDSPGDEILGNHGKKYKEFFGSASEYTKGHKKYVEGHKVLIEAKDETLINYLDNSVSHGVRSCISYLGGKDMSIFNQAEYIVI